MSSDGRGTDGVRMAKAKRTKPHERLHEWRVTLLRATPARYLGHVDAPDEATAIDEAVKKFSVPDNLRNKIAVTRDD